MGVVVRDLDDVSIAVQNSRHPVRRITLGSDAVIPVVEWICGILQFDEFEPCVLPRRLIKMPMNADVAFHQSSSSFTYNTMLCGCRASLLSVAASITSGAAGPCPIHRVSAESKRL